MGKQIHLSIADPCHENWDNMTAAEQGRFCASCQKQVVDFTNMTDAQLAAFFKKASMNSVCGRFYDDQLNRNIQTPKKAIPWIKYFFQIALPAFLMSAKATAQGNVIVKETEAVATPPPLILMGKPRAPEGKNGSELGIRVKGKVVNENNSPIPYASVIIKDRKFGVPADSSGTFDMGKITAEKIVLEVSSVGYQAKKVIINTQDMLHDLIVRLEPQMLNEVVVTSGVTMGFMAIKEVRSHTIAKPDSVTSLPLLKIPAEKPAMIKVYPNPVLSGTAINIGCEKLEEGYYSFQLFNQSGQQIESKQVWIDAEARIMNMEIPPVPAGSYILTLIHKESGKRFSEKIIVQ